MPISTINNKSIADGTIIATDILDGTISSAKLVAANIAGDRIAANTLSNTVFQTGSVESYLRGANLDFGMRNRIINGAMRIDQRNAGAAVTPTSAIHTLDRWQATCAQSSKYSVQQDSSANTVAGFTSSLKVTSLSSYSVLSTDTFTIRQIIEGYNVADLAWGTASAAAITLSFWVRSSLTGTFGVVLGNGNVGRSYGSTYTINSANTWEQKFITVPGDTGGALPTDNSASLYLIFGLGVGSSVTAAAGSWQGSFNYGVTGATSIVGTNGATWYVTGVQVEKGSVPTPFEYRQYGTELNLCQRYYFKANHGSDGVKLGSIYNASLNRAFVQYDFHVTMRTQPSVVYTIGAGTLNYEYLAPDFAQIYLNNTTSTNLGAFAASAEL